MNNLLLQLSMITLTLIAYILALKLTKLKFFSKAPIILVAVLIVFVFIKILNIDIPTYQKYTNIIFYMLGPAIVALSIPLIKNFSILKKNYSIILTGVTISTIFAILSVIFIAFLLKLESNIVIFSIIPKSVTAPVAIEITKILGGKQEITIILVIFSGLFGAIFGHSILKIVGVKNNLAVGSAIGFVSHILGTASCFEKNLLQATACTITLILSCITTAIIAPIIVNLLF